MTMAKPSPTAVAKAYIADFKTSLDRLDIKQITKFINLLETKRRQHKTVFFIGNGGSAATASHAVCDLNKTVLGKDPQAASSIRFRAMCLSDNVPSITAIGNDLSYDDIFSEQLKNYSTPGDLLVVISGSGNSPNIIHALETAHQLKLETIGLLGFDGGKAKDLIDHPLIVENSDYGIIEDTHMMLIHLVTRYFKELNSQKWNLKY